MTEKRLYHVWDARASHEMDVFIEAVVVARSSAEAIDLVRRSHTVRPQIIGKVAPSAKLKAQEVSLNKIGVFVAVTNWS